MKSIHFFNCESRSEMMNRLEGVQSAIVGLDSEGIREYYIADLNRCMVGVCSQGFGIRPSGFELSVDELCFLGYNETVSVICSKSCQRKFEIELGSPFYEFIYTDEGNPIVAVHELGVVCLSPQGEVLWQVETDIVDSVQLEPTKKVVIKLMEGESFEVDMLSGRRE